VQRGGRDLHEVTGDRTARWRRIAAPAGSDRDDQREETHANVFGSVPLRVKIRA